jgi:hypothetical protein
MDLLQSFGSGGSSIVIAPAQQVTISSSWTRYSATFSVPSLSGKTIGTSSNLSLNIFVSAGSDLNARTGSLGIQTGTFDIWGVQLEAGSSPTPFRRNANSIQGELAACQRYYIRYSGTDNFTKYALGYSSSTTNGAFYFQFPVEMRTKPSAVDFSTLGVIIEGTSTTAVSAVTLQSNSGNKTGGVNATSTGLTANRPYELGNNTSAAGFIGFSAEL